MIKGLLSIVMLTFTFSAIAKADAKISGFMQHIIGMGDDIDGGVTDKFTGEGIIVPYILLIMSAILVYGLSDKIYLT